ncbi:MAG: peptidoglycan-binding domain-containing protein, partial [Pseudomonadota bacterium]
MTAIAALETLLNAGSTARVLKKGSTAKGSVKALQEVLYHLGYGKALSWDKFGPDGDYGNATVKAVKAFAKANGIVSTGDMVNAALGRTIVQ